MKRIIGFFLMIPLILYICLNQSYGTPLETLQKEESIKKLPSESDTNQKTIELTQTDMQLDHEVIQYKIIFHEKERINVSIHLFLRQTGMENKVFFLMLTDGNKSILPNQVDMLYLSYVPMGLIDITTKNSRFIVGQHLVKRILQQLQIGMEKTIKADRAVMKNDAWYLTIAALTPAEGDITVKLSSLHESMECIQLERHTNLELYTAYDTDFSGTYLGMKFFLFGCSYAKNLARHIETTTGSILHFASGGHSRGKITVQHPDGSISSNDDRFLATYTYHGNETGHWGFTANGWSLRWKYGITLFVIDNDPHFRYSSQTVI